MGKRDDFERFYHKNYMQLLLYAKRMVQGNDEACRDIVGDALEQAWRKGYGTDERRLKNYVYTVIHGKCVDYLRRWRAARRHADFFISFYGSQADDDSWREHEQMVEAAVKLLDHLNERTRYVLEECYFHHKRYSEVARELGISTDGVKHHIVQALKMLRAEAGRLEK